MPTEKQKARLASVTWGKPFWVPSFSFDGRGGGACPAGAVGAFRSWVWAGSPGAVAAPPSSGPGNAARSLGRSPLGVTARRGVGRSPANPSGGRPSVSFHRCFAFCSALPPHWPGAQQRTVNPGVPSTVSASEFKVGLTSAPHFPMKPAFLGVRPEQTLVPALPSVPEERVK